MQTVQSYLQSLDKEKLIETYLSIYPICYEDYLCMEETDENGEEVDLEDLPVKTIRRMRERDLAAFIDKMRTIPIKGEKNGRTGCLYAYRSFKDGLKREVFDLIFLEAGPDVPPYGLIDRSQNEMAGYLVADNILTQREIYGLMAFVIHEATFFGYNQEGLPEFLENLGKTERAIREGRIKQVYPGDVDEDLDDDYVYECTADKFIEWLDAETGEANLPKYEETPKEQELSGKVYEAMNAFANYSRQRERAEIFAKWKA